MPSRISPLSSRSAFTLIDSRLRGRCPSVFVAAAPRNDKRIQGFTLIELLVVIAILSVLAIVVVLTLNPAGLLQESRDATRVSDMGTLNTAIGLYAADGGTSLGSSSVIYVSIPDTTATSSLGDQCQGLGLPSLPLGYTYQCAASSTYRSTNGTGWIPVNLSNTTFGTPVPELPIDPVNTSSSRRYYTYTTNGSQFEVTSPMESSKYKLGGSGDVIATDGGTLATVYEKGSKLGLEPLDYGDAALVGYWTFDEGTSSVAYDYSGNNATGSWQGTLGSQWSTNAKVGGYAGQFNGTNNYVNVPYSSSFDIAGNITIAGWINSTNISSEQIIVDKKSGGAPNYDLEVFPSKFLFQVSSTSQNGNTTLQSSTWYYVAISHAGGVTNFYINGKADGTQNNPDPVTGNFPLTIGQENNVAYFLGFIDDIRIYNRALSATEIAALYSGGK